MIRSVSAVRSAGFQLISILIAFVKHWQKIRDFPGGLVVKNPPAKKETRVRSLGQKDPPGVGNGNLL